MLEKKSEMSLCRHGQVVEFDSCGGDRSLWGSRQKNSVRVYVLHTSFHHIYPQPFTLISPRSNPASPASPNLGSPFFCNNSLSYVYADRIHIYYNIGWPARHTRKERRLSPRNLQLSISSQLGVGLVGPASFHGWHFIQVLRSYPQLLWSREQQGHDAQKTQFPSTFSQPLTFTIFPYPNVH